MSGTKGSAARSSVKPPHVATASHAAARRGAAGSVVVDSARLASAVGSRLSSASVSAPSGGWRLAICWVDQKRTLDCVRLTWVGGCGPIPSLSQPMPSWPTPFAPTPTARRPPSTPASSRRRPPPPPRRRRRRRAVQLGRRRRLQHVVGARQRGGALAPGVHVAFARDGERVLGAGGDRGGAAVDRLAEDVEKLKARRRRAVGERRRRRPIASFLPSCPRV